MDLATAAQRPVDEVVSELATSPGGLSEAEAARRFDAFGPNAVATRRVTVWGVLGRQVRNPLLVLLVGAATVSAFTGDAADAAMIGVIVALSVGLGFVNEYRSERAVAALHGNVVHEVTVQRDGTARRIDVRSLVPGDVVELRMGDLVPADVRLLRADDLECVEAVLTGESLPAQKTAEPSTTDSLVDLPACAFMGTVVHRGSGTGVVVATGRATAFGAIAAGLDAPQTDTAFQAGLRGFSTLLVRVAAALTIAIFLVNLVMQRPFLDAVLFSLAIAIGITPQLLPAIVSVNLSTGSRRLARQRVLVKRLVTIEDLGNIEVLFTDKTGTLTDGSITFASALDPGGRPADEPLRLGLLCNEATLTDDGPVGGNALDVALWLAPGARSAVGTGAERIGTLPFDHERQLSSVTVATPGGATLITKGAPEAVLARCPSVPPEATATLERLFADGARVVAVARRPFDGRGAPSASDERDLELAGFLTFADRPKPGVDVSLAELRELGVTVKVITGDNGTVAATVCRELGLAVDGVLTGTDIVGLDDDALLAAVGHTTVFARVSPEQKARVVHVVRRSGVDVAFLGDGVNDAVALHAADVGISVDSAADVAKDAADIVLLEKDLGVLAIGVREGRRIFANTLKYVLMATSSNFGNMVSAGGASLFLSFLPMLPSQILLNGLLYDVGQLAIPSDRVDPEVLARPARWDVGFVRRFMTVFGPLSSIFDALTFAVLLGILHASHAEFRTGWFVESLATQTLVVYVIRTRRVPWFRSRPSPAMVAVPLLAAAVGAALPFTPLADPLGFTTLPIGFLLLLVGMTVAYLALVETVKHAFYRSEERRPRVPPTVTPARRHARWVHRRASRFTTHQGPARSRPGR